MLGGGGKGGGVMRVGAGEGRDKGEVFWDRGLRGFGRGVKDQVLKKLYELNSHNNSSLLKNVAVKKDQSIRE